MANDRKVTDRREFLQLMGLGSAAAVLNSSIAKALAIPANFRTGTIKDVEHIVILMQENNSFDEVFGTLRGVRGFSDPRAVKSRRTATLCSCNPPHDVGHSRHRLFGERRDLWLARPAVRRRNH